MLKFFSFYLACDCDLNGTIACSGSPTASRVVCDQLSGECACKTNVMGPRCNTCKVRNNVGE